MRDHVRYEGVDVSENRCDADENVDIHEDWITSQSIQTDSSRYFGYDRKAYRQTDISR